MRRPLYGSTSKSADRWYAKLGWVVLGVVSVLAVIGLFVWGQREPLRLDADNCLEDDVAPAQAVVLLDPSDSLSAVQRRSVASRVVEVIEDEIPDRTEIRLYTVARAGRRDAAHELRVCVPPRPDSIGALEALWTNRRILEREYSQSFRDPLEGRLNALLDVPSDTVSPIVEAVQAAVVDAFQPRGAPIPRHVLVVSDMVQNSADLSFFREVPDFGAFARNPVYRTLRVDLDATRVIVFLLARRGTAGRLQTGQVTAFWENYFLDSGAELEARPRWVPVEG